MVYRKIVKTLAGADFCRSNRIMVDIGLNANNDIKKHKNICNFTSTSYCHGRILPGRCKYVSGIGR